MNDEILHSKKKRKPNKIPNSKASGYKIKFVIISLLPTLYSHFPPTRVQYFLYPLQHTKKTY